MYIVGSWATKRTSNGETPQLLVDGSSVTPTDAKAGQHKIPAYVLYNTCEDVNGTCLFRRQDVTITVNLTD